MIVATAVIVRQAYKHGNCLNGKHPRQFSGGKVRYKPQNTEKVIVSSYSQFLYKTNRPSTTYGTTGTTTENTVSDNEGGIGSRLQHLQPWHWGQQACNSKIWKVLLHQVLFRIHKRMQVTFTSSCNQHMQQEQNENGFDALCHIAYSPHHKSKAGQIGLFIALTFHMTLETVAAMFR